MTTYVVVNGKGGVGRTSTAAELIKALIRAGRTVIGYDLDEQGNLTRRLGVNENTELESTILDVLSDKSPATIAEAAIPAPNLPGARIVVAAHRLGDIDTRDVPDLMTVLRDEIPKVPDVDDHVIDTPAGLTGLTQAALAAADVIIVVCAVAEESFEQLQRVEAIVRRISRRTRPGAAVKWVIPTLYHRGQTLDEDVLAQLRRDYQDRVTNPIRYSTVVAQSYKARMTVSQYAPRHDVTADYIEATSRIIRGELNNKEASA